MKHLFIINPVAGGRNSTEEVRQKVEAAFGAGSDEYEIYVTTGPLDALNKTKQAALSDGEVRVYACGGDGTLNECANGAAMAKNVAVTHFPIGTGNDFIKTFGEDKQKFFELDNLINGQIQPVDMILCNGRYALNVCSVGIDAKIGVGVHKYSAIPILKGASAYIVSVVANFIKGITTPMKIKCNGQVFSGKMTLVCAMNGGFYGGFFNPVPETQCNDGVIDFLVVRDVTRLQFIRIIGKYAKGRFREFPQFIKHITGAVMEIESPEELLINIDGEGESGKHVALELVPNALNFVLPQGMILPRQCRKSRKAAKNEALSAK